jgi:hypothetical protein
MLVCCSSAGPRGLSIGPILAGMAGTADTIGVVLGELGELAQTVAGVLGHSPAGAVAQVASLVFFDAAQTAHVVGAIELEQIRQSQATGTAAGRSAYEASRQNFARRCLACDATLRTCNMANATTIGGAKCCPDCEHPKP